MEKFRCRLRDTEITKLEKLFGKNRKILPSAVSILLSTEGTARHWISETDHRMTKSIFGITGTGLSYITLQS
jgi:hypothetical protein